MTEQLLTSNTLSQVRLGFPDFPYELPYDASYGPKIPVDISYVFNRSQDKGKLRNISRFRIGVPKDLPVEELDIRMSIEQGATHSYLLPGAVCRLNVRQHILASSRSSLRYDRDRTTLASMSMTKASYRNASLFVMEM